MVNKQGKKGYSSLPAALAVGAVVSAAITILILAFAAMLIAGERVGEQGGNIAVVIALILSAAAGSIAAYHKVGHSRLIVCAAMGGVYFVTLLACNALLFSGTYRGIGVTALSIFGGSLATAILGMNGVATKHRSRYTKHHNIKVVQNRQTGNR